MALKRSPKRGAPDASPLADAERACANARADADAFSSALAAYGARLAEQRDPTAELLALCARSAPEAVIAAQRAECVAALHEAIPTVAALDAMPGVDAAKRALVPLAGDRMAAPFSLIWSGGLVDEASFEIYDQRSPLGLVSANAYRAFLQLPACRLVRSLKIGNVACDAFDSSFLLGDPVALLAKEGLPPYLERLTLARIAGVTHAEDMGYVATERLSPLHDELARLVELDLAGCEKLGKLSLPRLRALRLIGDVTPTNLKELARADLPELEHLELHCDPLFAEPQQRWPAARALLRGRGMPRLTSLEIGFLDLDEDQRAELEDGDDEDDARSWVDLIADAPLLRRLTKLTLTFQDDDRELPRLVERAADFHHLAELSFFCNGDTATLAHPTRDAIADALAQPPARSS